MVRLRASRTNRNALRRRLGAGMVLACLAALATSTPAGAAVTIGQLPPDGASTEPCPSNGDYLQPSVTGGNLYIAKQAGRITSWSTESADAGATYVFKVFRRTSDPDVFQVVGRTGERTVAAGVNTFPADLHVESGDLIGLHAQGMGSSCTFGQFGDAVLRATGDLGDGQSATFGPVPDVRLNLAAVLVPSNIFAVTGIRRNRRSGIARITVQLSNPGLLTLGGKGVAKRHATLAVAGSVSLKVAAVGKSRRKLTRKGKLRVPLTLTFLPTGGEASAQLVPVKLKKRRVRSLD